MDVKFVKCASSKLDSVPVSDGQIIVLTDANSIYYDMAGVRRRSAIYGTSNTYGLVQVSDNYTSSAGAAASSVAASSKAVSDCYSSLSSRMNGSSRLVYSGVTSFSTSSYTPTACAWNDYDLLSICLSWYSNILTSTIVTRDYFGGTNNANRPLVYIPGDAGKYCAVYHNGAGSVNINVSPSIAEEPNYRVQIFGILPRA